MPRGNGTARLEPREELIHVEGHEIGLPARRAEGGKVFMDRLVERNTQAAAQRIEERTIDERWPIAGDQAVQPLRGCDCDVRPIDVDGMAERGVLAACKIGVPRERKRASQLIEVLLVRKLRIL